MRNVNFRRRLRDVMIILLGVPVVDRMIGCRFAMRIDGTLRSRFSVAIDSGRGGVLAVRDSRLMRGGVCARIA